MPRCRAGPDETYGDLAVEQKPDNRVGIGAMDRKLEPWMLREKNGEEPRKHVLSNSRRNSKRKRSRQLNLVGGEFLHCFEGDPCKFLSVAQKDRTLLGERDFTRGAVEQAYAKVLLKRLDLERDSRLR